MTAEGTVGAPTCLTRQWPNAFFKISKKRRQRDPGAQEDEDAPKELFWKSAQIMTLRYLGKELRLTGRSATQLTLYFHFHVSLVTNRLLTRHDVYYNPL
jgi:hypothetical protein